MAYQRQRKRMVAEMNVVPYIDVMLVLLVIFMITAPLLQQAVQVDLPEANAAPMSQPEEPLVVSVNKNGDLYLNVGGEAELVDKQTLVERVQAFRKRNPQLPVYIGGDRSTAYEHVYGVMAALQQAGIEKVGLMSDPQDNSGA